MLVCLLATAAAVATVTAAAAAQDAPRYELDRDWPQLPLGDQWITGGLGGMCVDSRDHVWVLNRQNIVAADLDGARPAPLVIEFDPAGKVVGSWGDPERIGDRLHDCHVDRDGHVWIVAAGTGVLQQYSAAGELLQQIGEAGKYDSSDGTREGVRSTPIGRKFFFPASVDIDPETARSMWRTAN